MASERDDSETIASGLYQRWRDTMGRLPGAGFVQEQAQIVETHALRHLQRRLRQISESGNAKRSRTDGTRDKAKTSKHENPARRLQALLDQSLDTDPERAQQEFHTQLLNQLTADEARILAALSDGGVVALCHIDATSRLGTHSERIEGYLTRLGNQAGVVLTENMPAYLRHLHAIGIIETGPEANDKDNQYEMLENSSEVRKTCERIETELNMKPRVARHSAKLSGLGMRLWQACQTRDQ